MASQYVINPLTQRPISVIGRTYRRMLKQGLLEQKHVVSHPEILSDDDSPSTINRLNHALPDDIQAVKGRGHLRGKAVKRYMPKKILAPVEDSLEDDDSLDDEDEGDEDDDDSCE